MYESVRASFFHFNERFEGYVTWMYLDVRGLVTVGVGNLIDPVQLATSLPFVHRESGAPARSDEIAAEWRLLKERPSLAKSGHTACEPLTHLRLSRESIEKLVDTRLLANEAVLAKTFAEFQHWPADAQLGVVSMAWALGAGFPASWPKFTRAAKARDWLSAKLECRVQEKDNAGVKPRNDANQLLFTNAAQVQEQGLALDTLHYPAVA